MKTMIISILLIILTITSCTMDDKEITDAIDNELMLYPKSALLDIYKNFFQGEFGPGHMIPSREAALNYLNYELSNAEKYDTVLFQPVGLQKKYYRVNLSLIRDSLLTKDELLDAFISGQDTSKQMTLEEWKDEWGNILSVAETYFPQFDNFEKDKQFIENNLNKGIIVGHHSKIFSETYHPHYRLVPAEKIPELKELIRKRSGY